MTTQILIRLPAHVAKQFRSVVPARQRSDFIQKLLEKNLPSLDNQMYNLALQAEAYDALHPEEFAEFQSAQTDGLDSNEFFDMSKLNSQSALHKPSYLI